MDRFDAMSVLVAAVDAGSLSAASRRLGVPLATVSRKVAELEARLKTQLLIRSARRLEPTDAGRAYIASCRRILGDLDEAERAAAGEYASPRGELTITAPIVLGRLHVLPVVVDFLHAFPDVDVRLRLADGVANLFEEHIDLAVRVGPLADSSLIAARIGEIRQTVVASPKYIDANGAPETPADLSRFDCVTFQSLQSPNVWRFPGARGDDEIPVRSRLTVGTAEAAIDAACAGLGVTQVLSYQAAEAVRAGRLRVLLRAFEPPPIPVNLVYSAQPMLPLKLRAFVDFAAPRLRTRVAEAAP
jgi:DNA-binding transcriptional LysR family regulator